MIIQSPESSMPEPYKTYVAQRGEKVAEVLQEVIGKDDMQLCPRAIIPSERVFNGQSHVYGAVVEQLNDGYKSILYSRGMAKTGIFTKEVKEATEYFAEEERRGNRVRLKDPKESDGHGQYNLGDEDEAISKFNEVKENNGFGCVLMPYLDVTQRISIGQLKLRGIGNFLYLGREETTSHKDSTVYGGTKLGLFHEDNKVAEEQAARHFEIPPEMIEIGRRALAIYEKTALLAGRVTVDVVEGVNDSGEVVRDVIDITPRMGGTTPAEILALKEIYKDEKAVGFSSNKLLYDPAYIPRNGVNFIETEELVINAEIDEIRR